MTDWSKLEHTYGTAEDVPDLLAKASEGSHGAVEVLSNSIAHQGWASTEVATVVVPLLWNAGRVADTKARAAIALLLADLACLGSHEHFIGGGFGGDDMLDGMLASAEYGALREAVLDGCEQALEWLEDSDAGVRSAAAVLLAVTQPDGATEALVARLKRERSRAPKSDIATALGWCDDVDLAPLRELFAKEKPEQFGAAVALAMHGHLDAEVAAVLVSPTPFKGSAWCDGELGRHGIDVLVAAAGRMDRDDLLYGAMDQVDEVQYGKIGAMLIKGAFPQLKNFRHGRTKPEPTPPLEDLSTRQRDLLNALARSDRGFWQNDMTFWLHQLGFWREPVSLREYLGHELAPSVLDLEFEIDGETTTLGAWLLPQMTEGADMRPLVAPTLELVGDRYLELCKELWGCRVEDGFANRTFGLVLLVEANQPQRLQEVLIEYGEHGVPSAWGPRRFRVNLDAHVRELVFALMILGAEIPKESPAQDVDRERFLEFAERYGEPVRRWIESTLG